MKQKELKEEIPVVFIHNGGQEYIKYALNSAKKYNSIVHLIGDESNSNYWDHFSNSSFYDLKDFKNFSEEYMHMSTNSYLFELNCFKRYFLLREFMKLNNVNNSFMVDSDVLTYADYSQYIKNNDYFGGLSIPINQDNYIWSASPHCSYWTIDSLDDFINYIFFIYSNNIGMLKEKFKWHNLNSLPGGICDMTLLYLWSKNKNNILNTAISRNDSVIDHNINISNNYDNLEYEYDKLLRIKKIKLIDKIPHVFSLKTNKYIRINSLHFQGRAKSLMKHYYYNSGSLYFNRLKGFLKKY
ncbi:hypothetical protein CPJCM30710_00480 [Clostridium polyendosporum]|uniref:Uncharacterized protein n=1 Tax=Clostridium polyendosporum TaxID=69208 RepID=A0A919RW36_9CLOT|nr:hypothetical protein [Clostridium polyendosporum]GIM27382.1 hypothetical protein CPJCM30710_00480 [Clostridium polyendosporum]